MSIQTPRILKGRLVTTTTDYVRGNSNVHMYTYAILDKLWETAHFAHTVHSGH